MNRSEFWVREYRTNRYMEHLSIELLSDRLRYLIENLTTLETNGKIGLGNVSIEPWKSLIVKFTHTQEEFNLRRLSPPTDFLKGCAVPNAMVDKLQRLTDIHRMALQKKPHLIKFGKKEYLGKNSIKVSLASSFMDPSLNVAQMDDEMKAIFHANPKEMTITTESGEKVKPIGTVNITYETSRDYYVFCSSGAFDVRMFSNFEADSCLFIYDSQRFADELVSKLHEHIEFDDYAYQMVEYVDPVKPEGKGKDPIIEFHKHLRYQYQQEYRHVFVPKEDSRTPKDIFLSMDSVAEYSELICL
ncbi:hypothetical protein [Vibrio vulnificus]|uniref:hypothetical protein n=1 Tax=Vibrio vulnificus TaxID=672 RepID=UPI001CDCA279|nr:hypothetical protein [Vibrio vulnificus]EIV8497579.1 hypothetical protein [Vibrio vulnificus]ELV8675387.1 hypothetical protein [Vibrio vulnificus]MCA3945389.1 hypothetical protein [Vibrio vulnificus]